MVAPESGLDTLAVMARPLRIEFEGALYHVMFRGNERQSLRRAVSDTG